MEGRGKDDVVRGGRVEGRRWEGKGRERRWVSSEGVGAGKKDTVS